MVLTLPKTMVVAEVGPRDGLQSFARWIDTDTKVRMIDRLSDLGLPVIEVSSFAHPKVVPHLRDAEAVFERIQRRRGTTYRALVPNAHGARRAAQARVDEMLGLITVSATYTKKNQNMSMEQALAQNIEALRIAEAAAIPFVMALGMAFWCPYEGLIPEENVADLVGRFYNAGIKRQYLAGSLGMEDPAHVNRLYKRLYKQFPGIELGFHIHNLSGMATANILASLDAGIHWLEGAICGIGGGMAIPSTVGEVGNFPLEDLVSMLDEMGVDTGLDPREVIRASQEVGKKLGIEVRSHRGTGCTREDVMRMGAENPKNPHAMA
jgi:hydroxymethylglutaryl-CoA lyase